MSYQDTGLKQIAVIDKAVDKLESILMEADQMNSKLIRLIRAILADDTATIDRFEEALGDASHISVVLEKHGDEEDEDMTE